MTASAASFTIRPARQDDLAAVVAIYNSTIPGRNVTADLQPVSIEERRAWFDAHLNHAARPLYIVQDTSGNVQGWGSFSDYKTRAAYCITAEISIYLAQAVRGQGWGKRLLAYMLAQAPVLGIRNVLAVIFGHNTASIKLFEQHGFDAWGHLPQVCDLENGHLADVVILGKTLPPPAA